MKLRNSKRRNSPFWFVGVVVTVSVLAWMHRFQRFEEPQLILSFNDVDPQEEESVFIPAVGRRSLLGETDNEKTQLKEAAHRAQAEADKFKVEAKMARAEADKAKTELEKLQTEIEQAKALTVTAQAAVETITKEAETGPEEVMQTTEMAPAQDRKVYYMPYGEVEEKDAFSASWLQRTEDFLTMELDKIGICEDAAFRAFRGDRRKMLRMTLDWFDFSLEHLSKWWKMFHIFHYQEVFDTAMTRLDKYLANAATFPMEEEQSFRETIAVIAYQPYRDKKHPEMAYNLTLKSLGATVESLRRVGFGRVVVVGDGGESDIQLTQDTFRHLQRQLDPSTTLENTAIINRVGHMEVAYTQFNPENAVTKYQAKNVPKATLDGLKLAFDLSNTKAHGKTDKAYVHTWLGDKTDWKYVYLTEPDSILQFRPSTLKQLKEQVDQGTLLVPHRLQPIPHESDAGGITAKEFLHLPGEDFPVMELDSIDGGDSCCDAHLGPHHKPHREIPDCGTFWYMCDFNRRKSKAERAHKKIQQYSLFRLKQGTEIVTMTALEHGRPCIPKKNDVCLPPDNMKLQ